MNEVIKLIEELEKSYQRLEGYLKLPEKNQLLLELQDQMSQEGFWTDTLNAKRISQKARELENFVRFWSEFPSKLKELSDVSKESELENDYITLLEDQLEELTLEFTNQRQLALLSGKYDDHDAILALHAGAGGVDAQDWTGMLLRMYLRYGEKNGFKTEILEQHKGSEAGVKSVLVSFRGPFAYGKLKNEHGVHRLVRLSPFNPAHTRETSFALVEVLPELEGVELLKLDPKDLKIETTTSSGHGGQSVNTTYSAVRITHIPSGLKVSIQNERSQSQNKEIAMKILHSKLQALEEQRQIAEKKEIRGEFKSAEWGNQIRSYVLHPYKLVKDHRTDFEVSDPERVLEGDLGEFIERALEKNVVIN